MGVTATAQSYTSILVSWNRVNGVQRYSVYQPSLARGQDHHEGGEPNTFKTIRGLQPCTSYHFKVEAQGDGVTHAAVWSDPSASAGATTLGCVSISSSQTSVTEGGYADFTVTVDSAPASDLAVNVLVTETGTFLWRPIPASVTISRNSTSASLSLQTDDDSVDEADATVSAEVQSGAGYGVGSPSSDSVNVLDNDPTVTISSSQTSVTEGEDVVFTVTADSAPISDLTVSVGVTQMGSFLTGALPTSVTISRNTTTSTLTVGTVNDSVDEPNGSVSAAVKAGTGYRVGSATSASVTVLDNDEAPPFEASILHEGTPIQNVDWAVLNEGDVTISVRAAANSNARVEDYLFKLEVNPGGTGFKVTQGGKGCPPSDGDADTGWFVMPRPTSGLPKYTLIRCSLGTGNNTGMTLKGKPVGGGAEFDVLATGLLSMARHRGDLNVGYTIDSTTIPYQSWKRNEILEAVKQWNVASGRTLIGPVSSSDTPDVLVKSYSGTTGGTCSDNALACATYSSLDINSHMVGQQTIWIKDQPSGTGTFWTWDEDQARFDPNAYYLETVLMHEFGHTVGLGHLPDRLGVMSRYSKKHFWDSPSNKDKYGLSQVIQTHTH